MAEDAKPHDQYAAQYAAGAVEESIGTTDADAYDAELASLWDDLEHARRYAMSPGTWTLQCNDLTRRIVRMTIATGRPTHWSRIQIGLLEEGVYQAIMEPTGMPYEAPDMARVAEVRASIEGRRHR
ncbi:hypothetical protein ABN028_19460 [Actinopolymorpha sp. B17G11]